MAFGEIIIPRAIEETLEDMVLSSPYNFYFPCSVCEGIKLKLTCESSLPLTMKA